MQCEYDANTMQLQCQLQCECNINVMQMQC